MVNLPSFEMRYRPRNEVAPNTVATWPEDECLNTQQQSSQSVISRAGPGWAGWDDLFGSGSEPIVRRVISRLPSSGPSRHVNPPSVGLNHDLSRAVPLHIQPVVSHGCEPSFVRFVPQLTTWLVPAASRSGLAATEVTGNQHTISAALELGSAGSAYECEKTWRFWFGIEAVARAAGLVRVGRIGC